ncbi:MAG: SDR family NAD(P)-dependent oxidoreductase [Pseudonocardiaceae bacterium]
MTAFTTCAGERGGGCGQRGGRDLVDRGEVVVGQCLKQGALVRKELLIFHVSSCSHSRDVAMPSVLITGCSSGFGLESALALARRGWQVFATMRDLDRRGPLEQAIERAGADADADRVKDDGVSARVELLQLDVCDQGSIDRAVAQEDYSGGRVEVQSNYS